MERMTDTTTSPFTAGMRKANHPHSWRDELENGLARLDGATTIFEALQADS